MARIVLTQGREAIVDDSDYPELSRWKWHAARTKPELYYARRSAGRGEPMILMHRQILQAPAGVLVDHADGNTLNNARANLRPCDYRQNRYNSRHTHGKVLKGVSFHKRHNKWIAHIGDHGKLRHLGYYDTPTEAFSAYVAALQEIAQEFARC